MTPPTDGGHYADVPDPGPLWSAGAWSTAALRRFKWLSDNRTSPISGEWLAAFHTFLADEPPAGEFHRWAREQYLTPRPAEDESLEDLLASWGIIPDGGGAS